MPIKFTLTLSLLFLSTVSLHAQYCASNATSTFDSKCDNVVLNGDTQNISNNTSGAGCQTYSNHTGLVPADLTQGSAYTVSGTRGTCGGNYTRYVNAWIDWNQDGDFLDANEMLGTGTAGSATNSTVVSINFTVPVTATLGTTRMRVIVKEGTATTSCGTYTYGETEDYTVLIASSGPMTYGSSTTTQASTSTVENCMAAAEILGVQVVTTGSSSPFDITQFTVGTAGTTSLGELSSISIYYTGNTAAYSPTNLFATVAPGGTVVMNGTQTLSGGTNYFWIVYNLITPTTITNTLDGTCTSIIVNGIPYAPAVTNPGGNRTIGVCSPDPGGVAGSTTWFLPETGYMTLAGANVSQWDSYVGGTNVNQATGTAQPLFSSNDISANFNGSVFFDGTSDELAQTSALGILGNTGTVIAVFRHMGTGTAFGSNANSSHYQMKQYNVGFSNSSNTIKWQRSQNATTPGLLPTHSSKTRINMLQGGTAAASYLQRNGNVQTATTSTAFGAIVNRDLSFGSAGGGSERSSIYMQEVVTFNFNLSAAEMDRVQTYLAIKYGVTLGLNGIAVVDYYNTSGAVVYDASANSGYAYEVAGVGRDDLTGLSQLKSHSTNGPANGVFADVLTVANGVNFASPSSFTSDQSYLIWGHDGGVLNNTNVVVSYPTDNSETILGIFDREWKAQESGTLNDVILEFDLSSVMGSGGVVGNNDLANLRLLVDEDGDYTNGATSIAPSSFNNITGIAYFRHDFNPSSGNHMDQDNGFFFTLGTTDMTTTPLPVELISFEVTNEACSNKIEWSTVSELNSDYFEIQRSYDMNNWSSVGVVTGAGSSNQELDYLYRDYAFEQNGVVYYRIVQVDTDGAEKEIGLQAVNAFCEDNYEPISYPNPATDQLNIESAIVGKITISDLNGRIVKVSEVIQGTTTIDISEMIQGSYMVIIELVNEKTFISQLVKL